MTFDFRIGRELDGNPETGCGSSKLKLESQAQEHAPVPTQGSNLPIFLLSGKDKNCGGKVNFRATFPKERCHKIICVLITFYHSEVRKDSETFGKVNFLTGFPKEK